MYIILNFILFPIVLLFSYLFFLQFPLFPLQLPVGLQQALLHLVPGMRNVDPNHYATDLGCKMIRISAIHGKMLLTVADPDPRGTIIWIPYLPDIISSIEDQNQLDPDTQTKSGPPVSDPAKQQPKSWYNRYQGIFHSTNESWFRSLIFNFKQKQGPETISPCFSIIIGVNSH